MYRMSERDVWTCVHDEPDAPVVNGRRQQGVLWDP